MTLKRIEPVLVSTLLLAFALRLFQLTTQSFWYDEGFTVYFARLPLFEQLDTLLQINPIPFHYLLTAGWMKLAGSGPYVLRFLSVLGSLLAVALCYRLGREIAHPAVGWVGALALTLSPMHIYYAQEARAYAWLSAWSLAAALLLYRAPEGLTRKEAILLVVTQVMTLFSQVYGIFTIAALNGLVLLRFLRDRPPQRDVRPWVIANVATLLIVLPWFWAARRTALATVIYFRGEAPWEHIVENALQFFAVGAASPNLQAGIFLFCLLLLVSIVTALLNRFAWRWSFLLVGSFAPLVGILLASIARSRYNARYIIGALPFFLLLFVLTWDNLQRRTRPGGVLYGMLLLFFFLFMGWGTYNQYVDSAYFRPDFRGVSEYIKQHGNPQRDGIVMVGGHFHPIMRYYLGEETFAMYPMPPNVIHNVDEPLNHGDLAMLNEAAARQERLWLILWQRELADPAELVLTELVEQGNRQEVFGEWGEIDVLLFEIPPGTHFDTNPVPVEKLNIQWREQVELLGFNLLTGPVLPRGEPLWVKLFWRATAQIEEDFYVSAQLIGADSQLYAQADHIAYNDFYPPTAWKPGELLVDRYPIHIPPDTAPGRYQLILVLYDAAGQRWLTPQGWEFVELSPYIVVVE